MDGGSKHLHGVQAGVTFTSPSRTMALGTLDAGIVCAGSPDALPTPVDAAPDFTAGVSVVLWDNLWGE